MRIVATVVSVALLLQQGLAAPNPPPKKYGAQPACPADQCFSSIRLVKPVAQLASSVCSKYIKYTATVSTVTTKTTTATVTSATQVNQPQAPVTGTTTITTTITPPPTTASPTCTTSTSTVTGTFSTYVNFLRRGEYGADAAPRKRDLDERELEDRSLPFVPDVLGAGCGTGQPFTAKISSACSCLLGKPKTSTCTRTSTVSVTTTVTTTNVLPAQTTTITSTNTVTAPVPTVTQCQTATTVTNVPGVGVGSTCGAPIAAYTSQASLTCDNVAPPGQTNAKFRIEGASEGNIFDGCIAAGPRNITTPSGGTHLCDGTNGGANPSPGGTFTTALDASGMELGYGFDAPYNSQDQDFFISTIDSTSANDYLHWSPLRNLIFTQTTGCKEPFSNGYESLWAFDADAPGRTMLDISPQVIVVNPADTTSVTLVITQVNPQTGARSPVQGATLGDVELSDANGNIQLQVPSQPGCYQYKAEMTNAIRSPTVYLTVTGGL